MQYVNPSRIEAICSDNSGKFGNRSARVQGSHDTTPRRWNRVAAGANAAWSTTAIGCHEVPSTFQQALSSQHRHLPTPCQESSIVPCLIDFTPGPAICYTQAPDEPRAWRSVLLDPHRQESSFCGRVLETAPKPCGRGKRVTRQNIHIC